MESLQLGGISLNSTLLDKLSSQLRKAKLLDCPEIRVRIGDLHEMLSGESAPSRGSFQWIDSELLKAIRYGDWIVLDNTNQSSDALLDRLNSLLEPDGVLSVNERGNVDGKVMTLRPHPEFRIFLLVDPVHGELSRPLRNRGVELFIAPLDINHPVDLAELLVRANCYSRNPADSSFILSRLRNCTSDRKFLSYFVAAMRRFETEVTFGVSRRDARDNAVDFARSLLASSGPEEDHSLSPIPECPVLFPSSELANSSPLHFEALEFLAMLLGALRSDVPFFEQTLKSLLFRLPKKSRSVVIQMVQKAIDELETENIQSLSPPTRHSAAKIFAIAHEKASHDHVSFLTSLAANEMTELVQKSQKNFKIDARQGSKSLFA